MYLNRCVTLLVVSLVAVGALCATATADDWTCALSANGIDGQPESLSMAKPWHTMQINSSSAAEGINAYPFEDGYVLASLDGPGCLQRMWVQNPQGLLAIYIDGVNEPVVCAPMAVYFSAYQAGYGDDIAMSGPLGAVSYWPVPFAKSCKVVVFETADPPVYELTFAKMANDDVVSMTRGLSGKDQAFFEAWDDAWADAPSYRKHCPKTEVLTQAKRQMFPQKSMLLRTLEGPGKIIEWEVEISTVEPDILKKLEVSFTYDGAETPAVSVPIGLLFAPAGVGDGRDVVTPIVGRVGSRMYCRFPMPFHQQVDIRLFNYSDQKVDIAHSITWRKGFVAGEKYFHTATQMGVVTGEPMEWVELPADAQVAGAAFYLTGGDVLALVDASVTLAMRNSSYTTPLTAFFNLSDGPVSGVIESTHGYAIDADGGFRAYRLMISDPVVLQERATMTLHPGIMSGAIGQGVASTVYYYSDEND